jgi:hypothetical protein
VSVACTHVPNPPCARCVADEFWNQINKYGAGPYEAKKWLRVALEAHAAAAEKRYREAASVVAELTNQTVDEYLEEVRWEAARKARRESFEEAARIVDSRYTGAFSRVLSAEFRARAAEEGSDE